MRCDSWASLLALTLASPCLGRKPKAKVATFAMLVANNDLFQNIIVEELY
jgi:hypothetical protein